MFHLVISYCRSADYGESAHFSGGFSRFGSVSVLSLFVCMFVCLFPGVCICYSVATFAILLRSISLCPAIVVPFPVLLRIFPKFLDEFGSVSVFCHCCFFVYRCRLQKTCVDHDVFSVCEVMHWLKCFW